MSLLMILPLVTTYIICNKENCLFLNMLSSSGRNERSLHTTYCQWLIPPLRLQLAAYDDTMGLKKFIQLSKRTAHRMQGCEIPNQGQRCSASSRQPDSQYSPEPEPMQIESTHLSQAKCRRRLTQGLFILQDFWACSSRMPHQTSAPFGEFCSCQ